MPCELHGWHAGSKSHHKVCGHLVNYIIAKDVQPWSREKKGASRKLTKCNGALGVGHEPDSPVLRGRESLKCMRLTKVKSGYDTRRKSECLAKTSVVELTCTSCVKVAWRRSRDV